MFLYVRIISHSESDGEVLPYNINEAVGDYTDSDIFLFKIIEGDLVNVTDKYIDFERVTDEFHIDIEMLKEILVLDELSFNKPLGVSINNGKIEALSGISLRIDVPNRCPTVSRSLTIRWRTDNYPLVNGCASASEPITTRWWTVAHPFP